MVKERMILMNNKREVTKKHIFDFEMKYRALINQFIEIIDDDIEEENGLTDVINNALTEFYNFKYYGFTDELCFNFLDDFKDIIDWDLFTEEEIDEDDISEATCDNLECGLLSDSSNLEKFLDMFHGYFKDDFCWINISRFGYFNESIIRKYKDKLIWDYISRYFEFSEEFMIEMKDYIHIDSYLIANNNDEDVIFNNVMDFIKDHFEEAITYKGDENNVN